MTSSTSAVRHRPRRLRGRVLTAGALAVVLALGGAGAAFAASATPAPPLLPGTAASGAPVGDGSAPFTPVPRAELTSDQKADGEPAPAPGFDLAKAGDPATARDFVSASALGGDAKDRTNAPALGARPEADVDVQADTATVSVTPAKATRAELTSFVYSGSGFTPGESIRILVTPPGGQVIDFTQVLPQFAKDDGTFTYTYAFRDARRAWYGDYQVQLIGELSGHSGTATTEITAAPGDIVDQGSAAITLNPDRLTQSDMFWNGIDVTVGALAPNEPLTASIVLPIGDTVPFLTDAVADGSGTYNDGIYAESLVAMPGVNGFVAASASTGSTMATWTLDTDPVAPTHPAENVTAKTTPARISALALALTGVTVEAAGFQPGEDVAFAITLPAGNTRHFGSSPANDDGTYSSPFYDSSGTAPLGTYTITLTGASSGYVTAPFEVIVDPNPPVVDPKVTVTPTSTDQRSAYVFGWSIEATGFIPGDYIRHWMTYPTGIENPFGGFFADENGAFTATNVTLPDPVVPPGTYVMHFAGRYGGETSVELTITKSTPPENSTLRLTATPSSLSPAELYRNGLIVQASGGVPGDRIAVIYTTPSGGQAQIAAGELDDKGEWSTPLKAVTSSPDTGTYQLTMYTSSGDQADATFLVDPDAGTPSPDISLRLSATSLSDWTLGNKGLKVSAKGLQPGEATDVILIRPGGQRIILSTEITSDEGTVSRKYTSLSEKTATGEYTVRLEGTQTGFQRASFTVTEAPAVTVAATAFSYLKKGEAHVSFIGVNRTGADVTLTVPNPWGKPVVQKVTARSLFFFDINTKTSAIPAGTLTVAAEDTRKTGLADATITVSYRAAGKGVRTFEAPVPQDFAAQAQELPSDLTQAIRRDLDVSPEEYLASAEAAHLAETVTSQLDAAKVSETWVDAERQLHVLTPDAATATLAADLGAVVAPSDALADQAAAANAAGDGRRYYVDRTAGEVRSYDPASFTTTDVRAAELEGGDGFLFKESDGTYRCSLAFAGQGAFGQPVNLTAGHCVEGTDRAAGAWLLDLDKPTFYGGQVSREAITGQLGWTGSGEIGNDNDGGLLNLKADHTAYPRVSTWGGGALSQDDGEDVAVYDSVEAIQGMPVCKSGSTTGWTCGTVIDPESTETIGNGQGGIAGTVTAFIFDACILSGDSGGAILSGNYALGVDSFGNMRTCEDAGKDGYLSGGFAVRSGTTSVATQFGEDYNLSIAVGAPTLDQPAKVASASKLSGTVAAAAGATVAVTVDDVPYAATVDAAGTWSVQLAKPLAKGAHKITLQASHTARGSLATTTGAKVKKTLTVR